LIIRWPSFSQAYAEGADRHRIAAANIKTVEATAGFEKRRVNMMKPSIKASLNSTALRGIAAEEMRIASRRC
jgi:hypothetical protein